MDKLKLKQYNNFKEHKMSKYNKEYYKEYYKKHRERLLAKSLKWGSSHKKERHEYYIKHKLHYSEWQLAYYQKNKQAVFSHYSNPIECACCKEKEPAFLCIDHINGGGYQHCSGRGGYRLYDWIVKNNFPPIFRVLCYNCNQAVSRGKICPHQKSETKTDILEKI